MSYFCASLAEARTEMSRLARQLHSAHALAGQQPEHSGENAGRRLIVLELVSMAVSSGSAFTCIPNLKYKRSKRRLAVFTTEVTDSADVSTLGQFRVLPIEIFHILLEYLSVKDLSVMSIVSKAINRQLISYISSPAGNRRLLCQDFHCAGFVEGGRESPILEHYRVLGLLFKRCTLLLPTRERLKFIYKTISEIPCFQLGGCPTPDRCLGLLSYGAFLKILTAGWDELECHRVYIFLCDVTNLPRKIQTLVSSKPGTAYKLELRMRLFCRHVFLDNWNLRRDSAFWLTRLLKPWPMVNQARLLYIFYGPVNSVDGHIAWLQMTEGLAGENCLKGLADAIKLLYDPESKEWTADDVISLVDELSVVPNQWLLENNARLLILSGNSICFTFMASKAVNGRTADLGRMVVFLALVCEKDLYCMDWAVKMMQRICKVFGTQHERKAFLQNVESSFVRVIVDLLQSVISGRRNGEDSSFINLFHLVSAQANFHKEILYLTLNTPSV
ncbi:F-box only protein 47 [Eleutherodactylus coqui]|uniref:F-box only protein 47 n=1 Tax=Eleutherodactylus coqui TaxID=57060 RepID=UPI00346372F1